MIIDISSYQRSIDWPAAVAAGVEACIVKITEGRTHTQPGLVRRIEGVVRAGLPWSGYHFARPDEASRDAEKERRHYLSELGQVGHPPRGVHWCDVETGAVLGSKKLARWVAEWCDTEERCGIYCNRKYARMLADGALADAVVGGILARCPLWIAHPDTPTFPRTTRNATVLHLWPSASLWQKGSKRVPWCSDRVLHDYLVAPTKLEDLWTI